MSESGRKERGRRALALAAVLALAVCAAIVVAESQSEDTDADSFLVLDGQTLILNMRNGANFVIGDNITVSDTLVIEEGVSATIDLNGKDLGFSASTGILIRGSLTIVDSTGSWNSHLTGHGTIVMEGNGSVSIGGVTVDQYGGSTEYYTISNDGGTGQIIVADATVSGNGGIVSKGDVTISSSRVSATDGYAVTLRKTASLHTTDSTLEATSHAIFSMLGTGNVTVDGGTVYSSGNSAIYLAGRGNLTVNDATVRSDCEKGTSTLSRGTAGIEDVGYGNVTVNGGTVSGKGYGIIHGLDTAATVTVNGCTVTGAVGILSCVDVLVNETEGVHTVITGTSGAGIQNMDRAVITVTGGTVTGATYGILLDEGTASVTGGTVSGGKGDIGHR